MERKEIRIKLPEDVGFIIGKLGEAGHEAFAVGGCVRDSILGRIPGDWDITTDAKPEEVKRVFKKTVDTGIEHGTVTVILKNRETGGLTGYEVTTYRVDGAYKDGRHPESVTFTPSLKEDLKRRDFTVNAMAYNDETGLVDEFGGIEDLKARIIKCVGDANERFDEDALRILRAVRFAARLGFTIEAGTEEAIKTHAENLKHVSKERIQAELTKLLCSKNPSMAGEIFRLGMAKYICEGFENVDIDGFTEEASSIIASEIALSERYKRYALLLAGMDKKGAEHILKGLKLDNDTIKKASILAENIYRPVSPNRYLIKKLMQKTGRELFHDLVEIKRSLYKNAGELYRKRCPGKSAEGCEPENIEYVSEELADIEEKAEPVFMSDLAVRGADLMAAGVEQGPHLGEVLNALLDDVLREPEHNNKEYLLQHIS